ncbi:MAG: GrpB family protein [Candidatus Latescibacteria bacterium]|nr:GrpB family protein [Candidatus Latescibacterota bacterium]
MGGDRAYSFVRGNGKSLYNIPYTLAAHPWIAGETKGCAVIEIIPYQIRWPEEFAAIGAHLRQLLGRRARRIDHIGSTSVPGLGSKDIIDLQLTLDSFADFAGQIQAPLEAAGFVLRPHTLADHRPDDQRSPGTFAYDPEWEKRYLRERPGDRVLHMHVRVQGRKNQRYALLFRDYLRAHPQAAAAYQAFKMRLAKLVGDDRVAYPDTKDPVCDLIIQAAEMWAAATAWTPGPADA